MRALRHHDDGGSGKGGREAVEVDKFKTDLLFGNEDSLKIGFQFDCLISAKLSPLTLFTTLWAAWA